MCQDACRRSRSSGTPTGRAPARNGPDLQSTPPREFVHDLALPSASSAAVNPEAGARELPPEREGGLVAAQEAGNDQHRLTVERSARPALAEGADRPADIPRDLAPIAASGRRVVAFPLVRQRNSRPINCCIALGSRTRPSVV